MKTGKSRNKLMDKETRQMLPVIFSLAWPTMLEQLMQTAVQYMDTGMSVFWEQELLLPWELQVQ